MAIDPVDLFLRPAEEGPSLVSLKALSVRMPLRTFRYLEEMAEHTDLSRNAMAVQLIEWGIAHALSRLPEEICDQIGYAVDGENYYERKHLEDF